MLRIKEIPDATYNEVAKGGIVEFQRKPADTSFTHIVSSADKTSTPIAVNLVQVGRRKWHMYKHCDAA